MVGREPQFHITPEDQLDLSLYEPVLEIHMGYDDYNGYDQQTPVRIEEVQFSDVTSAAEARWKLMFYVQETYGMDVARHFKVYLRPKLKRDRNPLAMAKSMIDSMAENYTG